MGAPDTAADRIEYRVEDMRGNVIEFESFKLDTNPETRTFTAPAKTGDQVNQWGVDVEPVAVIFEGRFNGRSFSGFERISTRAGQQYIARADDDHVDVECADHRKSIRAGECSDCLIEDQETARANREKVKTR